MPFEYFWWFYYTVREQEYMNMCPPLNYQFSVAPRNELPKPSSSGEDFQSKCLQM